MINEIDNTRIPKDSEFTTSENRERISIHENGVLTPEAAAIADPMFEAAQEASKPMVQRIEDSRRITAEDLNWTATI